MPRKTGDDPTRYVWSPVRGKTHFAKEDWDNTCCGRSIYEVKNTHKLAEVTCKQCAKQWANRQGRE
jgi:hypothetical protein